MNSARKRETLGLVSRITGTIGTMPNGPRLRLDTLADRGRLSRLLAFAALVVGGGTIVLATAVGYGPPGGGPGSGGAPSIAVGAFLGVLVGHAGLYFASAWLPASAVATLGYLVAQLGLAVGLARVAGGVFSCLFFFVVVGAQAVSYCSGPSADGWDVTRDRARSVWWSATSTSPSAWNRSRT